MVAANPKTAPKSGQNRDRKVKAHLARRHPNLGSEKTSKMPDFEPSYLKIPSPNFFLEDRTSTHGARDFKRQREIYVG